MKARLGVIAMFAAALPAIAGARDVAAPMPASRFVVTRIERGVEVRASALLHADAATAWRTLVDYARLPDFIPDMQSSEALRRDGDEVLVRQTGRAGFGPIAQPFSLTLQVRETPMREIAAYAVAGDFARFESAYFISAGGDGATHIDFVASIEPKGGVPLLLGMPALSALMRKQFDALLAEIERRARVEAPPISATNG